MAPVGTLHLVTTRSPEPAATPQPSSDGRRLRRDRNRDAVVTALLELYNEGNLDPSAEEIAIRSGVSARSVFRYFDDVDDLSRAAIDQQQHAVRHLLPIDASPDADLTVKARALARQRSELFEAIESVGTVSRLKAPFQLLVAERLTEGRQFLRDQLRHLFAPELAALRAAHGTSTADRRLAAADIATSFESYRLLRDDHRLSRSATATAMTETLVALLSTR